MELSLSLPDSQTRVPYIYAFKKFAMVEPISNSESASTDYPNAFPFLFLDVYGTLRLWCSSDALFHLPPREAPKIKINPTHPVAGGLSESYFTTNVKDGHKCKKPSSRTRPNVFSRGHHKALLSTTTTNWENVCFRRYPTSGFRFFFPFGWPDSTWTELSRYHKPVAKERRRELGIGQRLRIPINKRKYYMIPKLFLILRKTNVIIKKKKKKRQQY